MVARILVRVIVFRALEFERRRGGRPAHTNRIDDSSRCLADRIGEIHCSMSAGSLRLGGLSMRDIQIARGRRGGHDGVHGGLRWSIGAWILDRLKGFRHVECSLVFFDRFHVDANMRRRGMKQAQKARGAHKVNIDAQQRFKRANRSGSLARTGLLSFRGGNPCVLQNVVKGTA